MSLPYPIAWKNSEIDAAGASIGRVPVVNGTDASGPYMPGVVVFEVSSHGGTSPLEPDVPLVPDPPDAPEGPVAFPSVPEAFPR